MTGCDYYDRSAENGSGALGLQRHNGRELNLFLDRDLDCGRNEGLKLSNALSRPFRPLDICGTQFPRPIAWAKIFRPVGPVGSSARWACQWSGFGPLGLLDRNETATPLDG
jgi:hypothetical protein